MYLHVHPVQHKTSPMHIEIFSMTSQYNCGDSENTQENTKISKFDTQN